MNVYDPAPRYIGLHRQTSEMEARQREAALRLAEHHFTAAEFSELLANIASGCVDVRIYDDAIVLMRDFRQGNLRR